MKKLIWVAFAAGALAGCMPTRSEAPKGADAAKPFYEAVFGWQFVLGENDPSGYLHIKNREHFIGGRAGIFLRLIIERRQSGCFHKKLSQRQMFDVIFKIGSDASTWL